MPPDEKDPTQAALDAARALMSGGTEASGGEAFFAGRLVDQSGREFRLYRVPDQAERYYRDTDTRQLVKVPAKRGGLVLTPIGGGSSIPFEGGTYMTTLGRMVQLDREGVEVEGRQSTQSERDDFFGTGEGTGGTGTTFAPGTAEANAARAEVDRATAELLRLEATGDVPMSPYEKEMLAWQKEKAKNDLREARQRMLYGEIGATKRTLIQEKGQARQLAASFQGKDPFRQQAVLSGGVMRGTSPAQAFGKELQGFIDQPLPEASMDMSPQELEGILAASQGLPGAPTQPTFGLADGGVIDMEQGGDGAFSMKRSFLVGEKGPEVMTVGDGQVEVTPLGGAFADGGTAYLDQQGGLLGARQALAPLFQGYGGVPRLQRQAPGAPMTLPFGPLYNQQFGNRADLMSSLGISPQLVHYGGTIYYNEDGTLRPFTSMESMKKGMGFRPSQAVNVGREAFSSLGTKGKPLHSLGTVPPETPGGAFGAVGRPIVEPSTGIILPAIHKIAGIWNQLRPDQKVNIISAYGMAGIDYETGMAPILEAATPQAGAFGRRIGFTGGFAG